MEGTRHEKIILVILAYIIGLTTGFIAFGLNHLAAVQSVSLETSTGSTALKSGASTPKISSVSVGEDGLFALTNGYKRMLSANKNAVSANALSSLGSQGYFYKIIDAQVSPDGQYLYYCEQVSEDADTCSSYIYALNNDSIYPVKRDGAAYMPPIDPYDASWDTSGLLTVNDAAAKSSSSPWMLYTQNPIAVH